MPRHYAEWNRKLAQRIRVATFASLPAAITVGMLGLTAPTAGALPISNLQNECRQANGTWEVEYGTSSTGLRYVTGYRLGAPLPQRRTASRKRSAASRTTASCLAT